MRPTKDEYFMGLAKLAASRTTCIRRGVGCVLVDMRGHVLSIAYNGVASGMPHCIDGLHCPGYDLPPGQDNCEAIHAEQNALLQCTDVWTIHTAYVTLSPCKNCLKLLLNTSCTRIIFLEEHADTTPRLLWEKSGRLWQKFAGLQGT